MIYPLKVSHSINLREKYKVINNINCKLLKILIDN